ncbi:hypothetical protein MBLNU459_g6100t2 [Dothideomycetes sp. NU459]
MFKDVRITETDEAGNVTATHDQPTRWTCKLTGAGVGVGDATASPTAALMLSILQDSMGRIATILFAHRLGTALEPECKMYRLLADIFNDIAMVLDCLSPAFPKPLRVIVLSGSSILRALCGVAAGSSKASLSAHFARWGNLGELNAKDSSQETIISLLGMLAGSLVVSWVTTPLATWSTLIALLALHLATNHAAVRSVSMRSLNRQRANILLSHMITYDKILTPQQVSTKERTFEHDGAMRDAHGKILGFCKIGVSTMELLEHLETSRTSTGSIRMQQEQFERLLLLFKDEDYILHFERASKTAYILLKKSSNAASQIKAWYHVLLVMHMTAETVSEGPTKTTPGQSWDSIDAKLRHAGWDLSTASLETRSGSRISMDDGGTRVVF